MKTITIEHETDTAHRLVSHKGKCNNLHGHRYRYVITIEAKGSIEDGDGTFVDFYDFKRAVREFLDDLLDHGTFLWNCSENTRIETALVLSECKVIMVPFEPTVENMVSWLAAQLDNIEPLKGRLVQLTIYETPTNYCTWALDNCRCLELVKKQEVRK